MSKHCSDNGADRALGQYWEREFCKMAAELTGFMFTPMQIKHGTAVAAFKKNGRKWNRFTLPDIVIWTFPGQYHEIKHKNPTARDTFGLEAYRFYALLEFAKETHQDVMYTIHNHDLSGGRDSKGNNPFHWFTANVLQLDESWVFSKCLPSWVNGKREEVLQYFWPASLWIPLTGYWGLAQ